MLRLIVSWPSEGMAGLTKLARQRINADIRFASYKPSYEQVPHMPRPKHGLGQGLDALVSSRRHSGGWPESGVLSSQHASSAASDVTQWEYACLLAKRRRKQGKRRLALVLSNPDPTVRPRKQRFRGVSPWTALGLLGANGWELVSAREDLYVLKRMVPPAL